MKMRSVVLILVLLGVLLVSALSELVLANSIGDGVSQTVGKADVVGLAEESIGQMLPFSDKLLELKTIADIASGKRYLNGVFITPDRLIQKMPVSNAGLIEKNIRFMGEFSSVNKYLLVIPSTEELYQAVIPRTTSEKEVRYTTKSINELVTNINKIDAASVFGVVKDEYLYYRTDEHLTSLGGYYLYKAIGKKMGFQTAERESFDIDYLADNFFGSLSKKTNYYWIRPDSISTYSLGSAPILTNVEIRDQKGIISGGGETFLSKRLFGADTIGRSYWYLNIETQLKTGQSLLVFASPIGNAIIPYLALHYKHITVITPDCPSQYYVKLKMATNYDQVLFCADVGKLISADLYSNLK